MSIEFCQPFQEADLVALGQDQKTIHAVLRVPVYWTGQEASVAPGKYVMEFDHVCDIHHIGVAYQGILLYLLPDLVFSGYAMRSGDTLTIAIPGRIDGQPVTVEQLIEELNKYPKSYKVTHNAATDGQPTEVRHISSNPISGEVNLW